MCDPVSLGVASLAVGAVGTYAQYYQQNENAKYQQALNEYNNKLSAMNMANNMNTIAFNQNQQRDSATEQIWRDDLEARRAEARARVAAGESGISGLTIDSLMREIKANQAMYAASVNQNLAANNAEADAQRRQVWNTYLSEVGNRTQGQTASALMLGVGLANAGLSAYNTYDNAKFRKDQRLKSGVTT